MAAPDPQAVPLLNHQRGEDGALAEHFLPGPPVLVELPNGSRVWVIRRYQSVLALLKSASFRNLGGLDPLKFAVTGVSLAQRGSPLCAQSSKRFREPLMRPLLERSLEQFRPAISELATARLTALPAGRHNLAPILDQLVGDIMCQVARLTPGDWRRLVSHSDRTAGTIIQRPGDHRRVVRSWSRQYRWSARMMRRLRRRNGEYIFDRAAVNLAGSNLSKADRLNGFAMYINALPTVLPMLRIWVSWYLRHNCPADVEAALKQALREEVHFNFFTIGRVSEPNGITLDGWFIGAGEAVLPMCHAAELDLAAEGQTPREPLAFGAGGHFCPGKWLSEMILAEVARVIARCGIRLIGTTIPAGPATAPVPNEIEVEIPRAA